MTQISVSVKGQEVVLDSSIFMIDEDKNMVNLTKIAKACGKEMKDWLRLPSTIAYLEALKIKVGKSHFETQRGIEVVKGGNNSGTWADRQTAIKFAMWISPAFEVWCMETLDTLFQKGSVSLNNNQPQVPQNFSEALKLAYEQSVEIEKQKDIIETKDAQINALDSAFIKSGEMAIGEFAKLVSSTGYIIGRNRMFEKLTEHKYLFKQGRSYHITQRYVESGLFRMSKEDYTTNDGVTHYRNAITITEKGQTHILKRLGITLKEQVANND